MTGLASVGPSALWYLTRATGAVSLLLLTVSIALGIAGVARLEAVGWPRFVIDALHRNASLLALALLLVHIVTSLLDPFAGIRLIDALIPFTSSYRPLWLGLGAFASDVLVAVVLTSVVRRRLGHRAWRATHWLAYVCWPVAVVHAAGTGSDIRQVWMLALTAACVVTVIAAVWARIGYGGPAQRSQRGAALAASVVLPLAFIAWLPGGPLAANWARRAGTPPQDLARVTAATNRSAAGSSRGAATAPASAFTASVTGTATQSQTSSGLVEVELALSVAGHQLDALDVRIYGEPLSGGGVQMTASAVSLGTPSDPALYHGAVTALSGTDINARVSPASGRALELALTLSIDGASGAISGNVQVTPA